MNTVTCEFYLLEKVPNLRTVKYSEAVLEYTYQ